MGVSAAWHTEDEEYLDNGHRKELGALWEVFKEDDVSSHTNLKQAVDAAFETVSEFTSVQRADFARQPKLLGAETLPTSQKTTPTIS